MKNNKTINENQEDDNRNDDLDYQIDLSEQMEIDEEFISQIDAVKPKKTRNRGKKVLFSVKDYYDRSIFVIKDFTENEDTKFKGSDYVRILSDMAKFFLANTQEETDTYKVEV